MTIKNAGGGACENDLGGAVRFFGKLQKKKIDEIFTYTDAL